MCPYSNSENFEYLSPFSCRRTFNNQRQSTYHHLVSQFSDRPSLSVQARTLTWAYTRGSFWARDRPEFKLEQWSEFISTFLITCRLEIEIQARTLTWAYSISCFRWWEKKDEPTSVPYQQLLSAPLPTKSCWRSCHTRNTSAGKQEPEKPMTDWI